MDAFAAIRCGEEPYMQFDKMQLRNYYPHEMEKLSVLEITQTKTFDQIGHPIRGGLYDPMLGASDSFDRCTTCDQYDFMCPGHFGHIRLDVPVFNPLLYQLTHNLMKGSCVHCHRLMCNSDSVHSRLIIAQLRCFDLGFPLLANDILEFVQAMHDTNGMEGDREADAAALMVEIDRIIKEACKNNELQQDPTKKKQFALPTKNAVDLKKRLVKNFLKTNLFRRITKCPLCKSHNGILRNDGARCLLIDFTSAKASSKAPKSGKFKTTEPSDDEEEMMLDNSGQTDDKKAILDEERAMFGGNSHSIDDQLRNVKNGSCMKLAWRGAEIREHFRLLWKNDGHLLEKIFPMFNKEEAGGICPLDGLFCENVLVPPTKFRPMRFFKGERMENPQTVNLRKLLEATETIRAISQVMAGKKDTRLIQLINERVRGKTNDECMHNAYLNLQLRMNATYDEGLNKADPAHIPGIKQILEKKQGLFRMNMMGKRVNFACRSVITPDPYLDIDEIGIPEIFAKKLTFAEPVTLFNQGMLKKYVTNGEKIYPGANGLIKPNGMKLNLAVSDAAERKVFAERLIPPDCQDLKYTNRVLRHLKKGDMMIMNRQPSLHKPSIMGHRARILTGQKALRMNYAPCKAYNADFDGDEMNGHLVQTLIAQTEVAEIANVGSNFLVPKDATPLLGLIQDHVVSGVLLTLRGRFFEKEDFMHLLLASFAETSQRLEMPPPCMLKPKELWSGKQVISAILRNCIPKDKPLINLTGKAKTPLSCWKVHGHKAPEFDMSESEVIFRQGELLVGVLDKQHYGATQYGLGHCLFELYGHRVGVRVLSCFSRLFTTFLQFHGFTLGVADILVRKDANKDRKKAVMESRTIGDEVVRKAFNLDADAHRSALKHCLASAYCGPAGPGQDVKILDYVMKSNLSKFNDAIVKACVPEGLIRSFPDNGLQMMIQSGAKGSMVNAIQISCNLGQIELEGKRMAVTVAGRTLPSFKPFDPSPRAGGYIDQRFLTGINPQELFFHTMAGREGLIDTAVKTSRSGYLQRCIIKHLEGIKVHYDQTVRDHDGSVIQFRYGEDGMDVCKSTFLAPKQLPFLEQNLDTVSMSSKPEGARDRDYNVDEAERQFQKIKKFIKKKTKREKRDGGKKRMSGFNLFCEECEETDKKALTAAWFALTVDEKKEWKDKARSVCPDPVDEKFNPARTLGALPEKMLESFDKFTDGKPDRLRRALFWKGCRSLAEPGENVGLLAAQSIGEPSTQMTLNTFHFAGRGEMNVTLGIPRLREILMTASKSIATPSATIAVLDGTPRERVDTIKRELDRVYLKQLISRFTIDEHIILKPSEGARVYTIRFEVLSSAKREPAVRYVKRYAVMREIEKRFIKSVVTTMDRRRIDVKNQQQILHRKLREGNLAAGVVDDDREPANNRRREDDGESSDEEAEGGKEADADERRLNNRHRDDAEYDGEDEEKRATNEAEKEGEDSEGEEQEEAVVLEEVEDEEGRIIVKPKKETKMSLNERVQSVIRQANSIHDYRVDANDRWCEVVLRLGLAESKLDVATLIEREVDSFIVTQTPGIERCILTEDKKDGQTKLLLQTQGINLEALYRHSDVLDVNRLYTNDLDLILRTYGAEACSRAIVNEMNGVFAVYGIEVSKRHLSLTADHMTFTGEIAPFNRGAMNASSSPLQKMTFETTIAFMREALITGEEDRLSSPSARLVVGSLSRGGTGAFDLLMDTEKVLETVY
ncbi:hypothetical protein PENTCL1PPCAC_4415 [Pristionchus entomophagus]|uniref:DNA-directed RNA polymerase subunit n=1 Tax=Pristionchus entomophagus TaxID=358040 RepID=A0AAV5SIG4_9BILA|nr:hypothetical protein PENTCL1PPCAC_4415 [Pristionchus entomophagus]